MVNANEWLERNYPKFGVCQIDDSKGWANAISNQGERRAEITQLNVARKELEGVLDVSDFINLERLNCSSNQLTSLILSKNGKLKVLIFSMNQLTKLDLTRQVNLEKLICYQNQLTQLIIPNSDKLAELTCYRNQLILLEIRNCIKLEILKCSRNKLTGIFLPTYNQLKEVAIDNNKLTNFPYQSLNSNTLIALDLHNNNLESANINIFSYFINLKTLRIGNIDEWVRKGIINKFYGSLSSLQNCTDLKGLDISNTNIDSGLEYLPDSLENFDLYSSTGYKSRELEKELKKHKKIFNDNVTSLVLLERWKEDFYQKNPNFKALLIKSITEVKNNNEYLVNKQNTAYVQSSQSFDKKLLPLIPLVRSPELNVNPLNIIPLNKDETSLLKTEIVELKSEIFQLKYKLTEAEDYIEKLEKQLLERKINNFSISNNPQTTSTAEFTESIEIRNNHPQMLIETPNHPQSIIYSNPQWRG